MPPIARRLARIHTVNLIRRLRANAPQRFKRRVGRIPPPIPPTQIERSYADALRSRVCDLARSHVADVEHQILRMLISLRQHEGTFDSVRSDAPLSSTGIPRSYATLAGDIQSWSSSRVTVRSYGETAVGPLLVAELLGDPVIVVVAGQHGDEPAAPEMWRARGAELLDRIAHAGFGARVYPCVNPEGYQSGERRDAVGDTHGNSFLEYLVDGAWVGELPRGASISSSRKPTRQAPELRALDDDLRSYVEIRPPIALIDQHQDAILEAPEVFAYVFGERAFTARALRAAGDPLRLTRLENDDWSSIPARTDQNGLVELRDGSITDWADWQGVRYSICVEAPALYHDAAMRSHWRFLVAMLEQLTEQRVARADAPDPPRRNDDRARARSMIDRAAQSFAQAFHPRALNDVVRKFGTALDEHSQRQLDQQVRSAIGVPYTAIAPPVRERVDSWAAENVDLIVTVPERYFDRLRLDVEDAFESGMHPETLAADFADDYDISINDARRIARDQLSKLNAQVTRARHEAIGVERYTWRTVHDNRVRNNHDDLDGQVFEYADPPLGGGTDESESGNPGEVAINCRCFAEPLLDDIINGVDAEDDATDEAHAGDVEATEPPDPADAE